MKTEHKKRDFILSVVSKYSGLTLDELKEKTRKREVSQNRQIACYFLLKYTYLTTIKVGEIFDLNHATVVYARKNICSLIKFDKEIESFCYAIDLEIKSNIKIIDNKKETKKQVLKKIIEICDLENLDYWLNRYNIAI